MLKMRITVWFAILALVGPLCGHAIGTDENEETQALEMGYTGRLADSLTLRAGIYYQRFKNRIGCRNLPDPLN